MLRLGGRILAAFARPPERALEPATGEGAMDTKSLLQPVTAFELAQVEGGGIFSWVKKAAGAVYDYVKDRYFD
jgi:hypothetical protein